jgi:hypothetical protein
VEVPAKRRERRRDNKIHVNDAEISRVGTLQVDLKIPVAPASMLVVVLLVILAPRPLCGRWGAGASASAKLMRLQKFLAVCVR